MDYSLLDLRLNQVILEQESNLSKLGVANNILRSKIKIISTTQQRAICGGQHTAKPPPHDLDQI